MERKGLIRITNNKVFLTQEMGLELSQTNLRGTHLSFRNVQDIFFEVELLNYNETTNQLNLRVTDYQPKNIGKFKAQKGKAQVTFIKFDPLVWSDIEIHLSSYTKARLLKEGIVIDDESQTVNFDNENPLLKKLTGNASGIGLTGPLIETLLETSKIHFKDADFNSGYVAIVYKSKQLKQTFNLKIYNDFILPEFNAVKPYFHKAFGGKKQFSINVTFILKNKDVTDIATTSTEIEGINETIIDSIKRERVAKLTSTPLLRSPDKSIFTSDEIFDSFDENLKDGNVFKQSEQELLNMLIETKNIRNAKHLHFLSGSKQSPKQKLRFTLKPLFGFLFFIEGETKNHFCWELLDSHATYLWSFEKLERNLEFQFKRIQTTINIIRDIGREAYKRNFTNNEIDNDLSFCAIEHSDINSASEHSFEAWQNRLNERLI